MSSRAVLAFAGLLLALVAGAALLARQSPTAGSGDAMAGGAQGTHSWPAPTFEVKDQLGRPLTSQLLRGQPYIASFLFTTCRTLCPLLTAKLVMVQRKLTHPALRFVSFSVDPAHDTQPALAEWHDRWHATEGRWLLARTAPESLARLAEGFGVAVEPGTTVEDPIIHTSAFLLVDGTGTVVGAFDSTDEDAMRRLEREVEQLLGAAPPRVELVDGERLVHSAGCLGCHTDAALAPPLQGVGRSVMLETGARVNVDRAYLRESLVSPGEKRVHGYAVVMPAYGKRVSEAQLEAMVTFIAALPVLADSDSQREALVVEDPVCHMKVRVVESTPRIEYDGGIAYFCAPSCRDAFRHPDAR